MKKVLCLLLAASLLVCLAACGGQDTPPAGTDPTALPQNQQSGESDPVRVLTLEKALHTYYEWGEGDNGALVRSEHSCVLLGQEDAEAYPAMAAVLSQIRTAQENTMSDEFDNLVSLAREEAASTADGFETYVSTLDVQVRRADSVVLSLLSDSYAHYGQIEHYRVFHGSNYDPQSGKELALTDVVKEINNDLALAVQEVLEDYLWTGAVDSEEAVQNYFADTPVDGFSWTVDYLGVTFYFAPGELGDGGAVTATVSFAAHPELFYEKYTATPSAYAVELSRDHTFFTQLDADGDFESVSVSGYYDEERNSYTKYGIYTDTDGQFYEEERYTQGLHPYFVKADSGRYLYLFCEDIDEGARQMDLTVFRLNEDGSVTKCGERNVSPAWLADNRFVMPTDPARLLLDDAENATAAVTFSVGNDGLPRK